MQSLRDIDYIIKDKLLFESILNVEFQDSSEKGYFYSGMFKELDIADQMHIFTLSLTMSFPILTMFVNKFAQLLIDLTYPCLWWLFSMNITLSK